MIDASVSPIPLEAVPYLVGAGGALAIIGTYLNVRADKRSHRTPSKMPAVAPPHAAPCAHVIADPPDAPEASPFSEPAARTPTVTAGPPRDGIQQVSRQSVALEGPRPPRRPAQPRRNDEVTLAPAGAWLHGNRERNHACARLGEILARLDRGAWLIERDVRLSNGLTIPYVVFGPTGVFLIAGAPRWFIYELPTLHDCAVAIATELPGYPDPVHGILCLPLDPGEPRAWFDARGRGGWVVGGPHLIALLEHFTDKGLSREDIAELRARATPDLSRPPKAERRITAWQFGQG